MSDVLNPVDVERKIRETSNRIAAAVPVVSDWEEKAKEARSAFEDAYAHAYLDAAGYPAHERKYRATVATMELRRAAEVAEVAFKRAERKAKALEKELFGWQTISNSVVAMYGAARA